MPLLPETRLLIAAYGNANFDMGEVDCDSPDYPGVRDQFIHAKDALIDHLETRYTPTPKA